MSSSIRTAVINYLSLWNPTAVDALLDLDRAKFEFVKSFSSSSSSTGLAEQLDLYIARFGRSVELGIHSDGASEQTMSTKYMISVQDDYEWTPRFGSYQQNIAFEAKDIDAYSKTFINAYLDAGSPTHIVPSAEPAARAQWTILPSEEAYNHTVDGAQDSFFGLPKGWRDMTDAEVDKQIADRNSGKSWDERDKWPYELMKPTVC